MMTRMATSLCKIVSFLLNYFLKTPLFHHFRLGELVLAKYRNDEGYYRAVCLSVSEIDCKISFVDYGSDQNVAFDEVYKIPKQFLVPCVSRTLSLKLASGKALKNVDVPETMQNFLNADKFEGVIETLGNNKYSVTVDDSYIIFN